MTPLNALAGAVIRTARQSIPRTLKLSVLVIVAMACLVGLISMATLSGVNAQGGAPAHTSASDLRAGLHEMSLREVSVKLDARGRPSLEGWVPTLADARRIQRRFTETPTRVRAIDEQARFAKEYLNGAGISANVEYEGAGVFRVSGSGEDESKFHAAIDRLAKAAPEIRRLESEFRVIPVAKPAATPIARAAELTKLAAVTGIDGVHVSSRNRYLTSGSHYVFEGGSLRDGVTIETIGIDRINIGDRSASFTMSMRR